MKALIAMSGGVDSSVAAFLTKEEGFECTGCTMKLYNNEDAGISNGKTCCSLDDVEDARSVAYRLGMPYYVFNFTEDFGKKIIDKFVDCYLRGITPNPCIDCNRYMKFDKLHDRARELGMDYVVTGHYAIVEKEGDRFVLKKAADETKDQSYVLYSMTQEQLAHTLFPLGKMRKTEARAIAERNGFVNADKPDSQDICFVPDGDYARVVEMRSGIKPQEGKFITSDGKVLGTHKGIIHYTIGQRRGLGIPGPYSYYVLSINTKDNTVVLGEKKELFSAETIVDELNWISGEAPTEPFECKVKIRYRHPEQPSTVYPLEDGKIRIVFKEPQRAITPGQAAVMYDGDTVLGGGIIQ